MNTQTVRGRKLDNARSRQVRQRQLIRQKRKRRRRILVRSTTTLVVIFAALFALLFLTPIFSVRNMTITGNSRINTQSIEEFLPDIKGKNLFKVNEKTISERLSKVAYIKSIDVEKKYFPASVTISITEYTPYAYYENADEYSVINENCTVVETTGEKPSDLPILTAYTDDYAKLFENEDSLAALKEFFAITGKIGLNDKITKIELGEDNEIEFGYEDRLDVICGSNYDMEQKLRLFKVTINNPDLLSNAHGTIDLSVVGKASYLP